LIAAAPTPCGGHRISHHARLLRTLLLFSLKIDYSDNQKNIVVLRRSGNRSIINHAALIVALNEQHGTMKVSEHTGKEPIITQLQLFANAQIAIGPHGAGLSNIATMSEGSSVIELQVAPANHCYLLLAFNLGLYYYAHYETGANHHGQWSVNIDQILALPAFHS